MVDDSPENVRIVYIYEEEGDAWEPLTFRDDCDGRPREAIRKHFGDDVQANCIANKPFLGDVWQVGADDRTLIILTRNTPLPNDVDEPETENPFPGKEEPESGNLIAGENSPEANGSESDSENGETGNKRDSHPLKPGTNPQHVRRVSSEQGERIRQAIDETYELQPVSLKLPASILKAFDAFGEEDGIAPRGLMRRILRNYAIERMDQDD